MKTTNSAGSVKLSRECTVDQYRQMVARQDRNAIANFIEKRFTERYLDPIDGDKDKRNGFAIMAVCCLMIEALESFSLGLEDSKGQSKKVFASFFSRWPNFEKFKPVSTEFYRHVRSGILHQAETTGGWRIHRVGPLLDGTTVNAAAFLRNVRACLLSYADELRNQPWDSEVWSAYRTKMDAICENAKVA